MIGRFVAILGGLLALAACTPPAVVTVNVSHVGTDKGYLNSRLARIGDLFLWDMKSKTISELDNVELTTKKNDDVFTKVDATYASGIDFIAGVQAQFKVQVESKIRAQSRFTLANARVTSFQHTFDDLSAFINNKISDGTTTAGQIWNLDEAVAPNSPLRYLLIYRVVLADKTQLQYKNDVVVGGEVSVPVPLPFGASANVKVDIT